MNIGFSQTAEHCINGPVDAAFFCRLPGAIREHTALNYSCRQTEKGCFLEPSFRDMPYRNSFVPEIDMVISGQEGQTVLLMTGRPVKFVRVFMRFWFGFLAVMELLLLVAAVTSGTIEILLMLIPLVMCVFGYLLCKIVTLLTFRSVVNGIRKSVF